MSVASMISDRGCLPPLNGVSGVILGGGKSRRYGTNKALAKVKGVPLIERVTQVMSSLFGHVILVTNTPDEYAYLNLPMHVDLVRGLGPLGGVVTGLTVIPENAGFFVACDMPTLNGELIRHLVGLRGDFDAVVPRISGKIEAIHALYHKRCLPAIWKLIDAKEYQIFRFFDGVSVRYVEEDEIRRFDPELKSFFNVNRPHDLTMLEKITQKDDSPC